MRQLMLEPVGIPFVLQGGEDVKVAAPEMDASSWVQTPARAMSALPEMSTVRLPDEMSS